MHWFHFWSLVRLLSDLWRLQNIKYKVFVLILPLFSYSFLIWKLPRLLLLFWFFEALVSIVTLLFISIIFHITQSFSLIFVFVFFGKLSGIDPYNLMALSIASMAFVFLKNVILRLTCNSWQEVVGLSLVFVFILVFLTSFVFFFLNWGLIALYAFKVNFSRLKKQL